MSSKKVDEKGGEKLCCFCTRSVDDEMVYGKLCFLGKRVAHQFCLFLSSKITQNGDDHEGMMGFMMQDIEAELRRGKRLLCTVCGLTGATLGCCNLKCRKVFHYPCGLESGALHQFFGEFRTYCNIHRPKQDIPQTLMENVSECVCTICHDVVSLRPCPETLWAPCCRLKSFFHRNCLQKAAFNSGYLFRCPLCNNEKDFVRAMREQGLYVPERDASWEWEPDAYSDLLHQYHRCDAAICLMEREDGRDYHEPNSPWEVVRCDDCGSQGIHVRCGYLRNNESTWRCGVCVNVVISVACHGNPVQSPASSSVSISQNTQQESLPTSGQASRLPIRRRRQRRTTTSRFQSRSNHTVPCT